MKYIISLLALVFSVALHAQPPNPIVNIGIFNAPPGSNRFEVRIQLEPSTSLTPAPGGYSGGLFTVRYLSTYGVGLSLVSSPYGYTQALLFPPPPPGPNGVQDGYNYYIFSTTANFLVSFNSTQEYVIAVLQHSNTGSGTGDFAIADATDAWASNPINNGAYYQEYNGVDVTNTIYSGTASAPLPVELTNFTAKLRTNKTVSLDWESASENRLAYYEVQRSTDGQNFQILGKVNAKGSVNVVSNYNLIDLNPAPGMNYYRLRMVDSDGSAEYSALKNIYLISETKSSFGLQPNPTAGPFTLMYHAAQEGDITVSITDIEGRLVKTAVFPATKGDNSFRFDDLKLSVGVYAVSVTMPDSVPQTQRLVVVDIP